MSITPNKRQFGSTSVIRVATTFTGAAQGTVWTPGAGKRIVLKGCALRARVTTALAGATPGDAICLLDNAVATPLVSIGIIATATDAAGAVQYGLTFFNFDLGYPLAAVNNVLKVSTLATITTGVIAVEGFVFGDES
jgi:hypothetical protein